MFPTVWKTLPGFVAHDWPPHRGERTLGEVAANLCRAYGIEDGDIVVGASLGGMVACEIAKIRRLEGLYLVGSATHREEISRLLAALHPLADLAPIDWLQACAGRIPSEFAQMFAKAEASFMRQMVKAIFAWPGSGNVPVRPRRLHGRHDLVIPPPPEVDLLLAGGHLISITHSRACVDYIRSASGL